MPTPHTNILKTQFKRVWQLGWWQHFQEASAKYGDPVQILIAIGSRETNLEEKYIEIPGDNGNGYGPMQIDRRSFAEWVAEGKWRDPREAILMGAKVLTLKRAELVGSVGRQKSLTDSRKNRVRFTVPGVPEPDCTRLVIAMYNAGWWPVYQFTMGRDPDRSTTGADYSADVLKRAEVFERLIADREQAPTEGASAL